MTMPLKPYTTILAVHQPQVFQIGKWYNAKASHITNITLFWAADGHMTFTPRGNSFVEKQHGRHVNSCGLCRFQTAWSSITSVKLNYMIFQFVNLSKTVYRFYCCLTTLYFKTDFNETWYKCSHYKTVMRLVRCVFWPIWWQLLANSITNVMFGLLPNLNINFFIITNLWFP